MKLQTKNTVKENHLQFSLPSICLLTLAKCATSRAVKQSHCGRAVNCSFSNGFLRLASGENQSP